MNSDESSRGMSNYMNRKPTSSNYGEKKHSYSPSSNFSYGNNNYNGNNSYNNGNGGSYNGQQQRPHRRPNGFKHNNSGPNDRLIKQNDVIIRLLKEIRDRLPPPPMDENGYDENMQDQRHDMNDMHEGSDEDDEAVLMEPAHEEFSDGDHESYSEDEEHR